MSQGKKKIKCVFIVVVRLTGFQNALWHLHCRVSRTYKKKGAERLGEGWWWGGHYITIRFTEGREKWSWAAERRERQKPSRWLVTVPFPPSLRDAPMHFTKQFGEVPNGWNVGSLHARDREECTVRANMHVTAPQIVRPISNPLLQHVKEASGWI